MGDMDLTYAEETSRAEAILAGLERPPEVERIRVSRASDADGRPALYLSFQVNSQTELDDERIAELSRYMVLAADAILRSGVSLFPYVSLDQAA